MNTKSKEIENKIPHTTGFISSPEFIRLEKIRFDAIIKEAAKVLPSKIQVDNALDIADKK